MSMQSMHLKYRIEEESKLDTNVDNSGNSVGRYFAGELNMCMAVIFDTLLLIIQSMCCVSCYVNTEIRYKKALILCPA